MIEAYLYIRVSTDEQADTGYSQRSQQEILLRWCEINDVKVKSIFLEDHSAKNFNRPEWQKMLLTIRKNKAIVNRVLFTKWDRFSRNAGDAYHMIKELNKLGVEPQAIEQPLDLDVPENKMMLAFYLAAPEVENDRRALNVSAGMLRAMKEGRYMGKAPIGYLNKNIDGKKYITPDGQKSKLIQAIFAQILTGKYTSESVLKMAREKGLTCSKNNFWNIIRNPVYCGKIIIPPTKNDPGGIVTGQHEPIIPEGTFWRVQELLDGRKKVQRMKQKIDIRFPLRGLLQCPTCGRQLTASASKGRKGYYEYYHCTAPCKYRYSSIGINDSIRAELAKLKPHPAVKVLYKVVLSELYFENDQARQLEIKSVREELTRLASRKQTALNLRISGDIETDDYLQIKRQCEAAISIQEEKLAELSAMRMDIEPMMDKAIDLLSHIDEVYTSASAQGKRDIIGSIYPEKLMYDGMKFRTTRINEAAQLIFRLGEVFSENKKGQTSDFTSLSQEVIPLGHFSNQFTADLGKLVTLFNQLKFVI